MPKPPTAGVVQERWQPDDNRTTPPPTPLPCSTRRASFLSLPPRPYLFLPRAAAGGCANAESMLSPTTISTATTRPTRSKGPPPEKHTVATRTRKAKEKREAYNEPRAGGIETVGLEAVAQRYHIVEGRRRIGVVGRASVVEAPEILTARRARRSSTYRLGTGCAPCARRYDVILYACLALLALHCFARVVGSSLSLSRVRSQTKSTHTAKQSYPRAGSIHEPTVLGNAGTNEVRSWTN